MSGSVRAQVPEPPGPPDPGDIRYDLSFSSDLAPTLVHVDLDPVTNPDRTRTLVFPFGSDFQRASDPAPGPGPGELAWIGFPAGPDSRMVPGELFYRASGETEPQQLTGEGFHNRNPAISPDGTRIAFESDRGGTTDIWVINVDGTGLRQVTSDLGPATWPAWSPDGEHLAYAAFSDDPAGDIYRIPAEGGTPVRLTDSPGADTEPAWHPVTGEITFTTTRFRPAGDVVRMSADGGPVTRILPEEWDSRQGAWSPDGARFAFVTTRVDLRGGVYLLEDGEISPVVDALNIPDQHPRLDAQGIYLVEDSSASSLNIWRSEIDGTGMVNLTRRPNHRELEPAWSPDGNTLAYTYFPGDSGARIALTDPDGQNLRTIAPPDVLQADFSPTWSPDGSQLALRRFTSGPVSSSTITMVDAATSEVLGEVPHPPGFTARDSVPAWSPDGTHLAFERTLLPVEPPFPDPPTTDTPADPGDEFDIDVAIPVPKLPERMDVVFLVSAAKGMGLAHAALRNQLRPVMDDIQQRVPGTRFALATYRQEGQPEVFRVHEPLTISTLAVDNAMQAVTTGSFTGQRPDDWIHALHQLATGTPDEPEDNRIEFRADATPIVVLIGDSSSPEPSLGHRLSEPDDSAGDTLQALTAAGIRVVGVRVHPKKKFADGLDRHGQATLVTEATQGALTFLGFGPNAVRRAVLDRGLRRLPITVTPMVGCDPGLAVSPEPPSRTVFGGQVAHFTLTVTVAPDATRGATLRCLVTFVIDMFNTSPTHEIVVRVSDGLTPLVRVDDVTVTTTDPAGAVVDYGASATDAGGTPLEPICDPPSGSLFPVGMTVVTCTATDADGNSATDTAVISVVNEAVSGSSIWVANLQSTPTGRVVVTDQVDLSSVVGSHCGDLDGVGGDHAPAWSPDGAELVYYSIFTSVHGFFPLCVVGPDGSDPRQPIPGSFDFGGPYFPRDPAWSPDGDLIAFAATRAEGPTATIWTVPAGGGDPRLIIGVFGPRRQEYSHPAFRVLPPEPDPATAGLALSIGVFPQPGYVGGDEIRVTYTVRNTMPDLPLVTVLQPALPAQLPLASVDDRCGSASRCELGLLLPGASVSRTFTLSPTQVVETLATGVATGQVPVPLGDHSATAQASALVEVVQPELELLPPIGPPGFVSLARGTNFPPGATVRLTWHDPAALERGQSTTIPITATNNTVEVDDNGTFTWQALVFRKDVRGSRLLVAEFESGAAGTGFGPVSTEFLVVPRTLQPPLYEGRG